MTFSDLSEQWPLRPMMMWSCSDTPTAFSALRTSRVKAMSSREGEGSPVVWLCATLSRQLHALKIREQFRICLTHGGCNWERFLVMHCDHHASSHASVLSRFDARHVTMFF